MESNDNSGKKRIIILTVSSLLLVAMVIAVTVGISQTDDDASKRYDHQELTAHAKAVQSICQPTDYKEACMQSLAHANSTDPKELIRAAFDSTKKNIREAANNSTLLKELAKDPRTKDALAGCKEMADIAVKDLERSLDQIANMDVIHFDSVLANLKVWLSGALTYQGTCLEGFDNTTGEAGEKMQEYLKLGMQLTSNGLAMVNEIAHALSSLNLDELQGMNRRLLFDQDLTVGHDEIPFWVDGGKRRLLSSKLIDNLKPNMVVAKDGSGKYTNITAALLDIPRNSDDTFVLYIKEGIYDEKIQVDRNLTHLVMYGDGPTKTRVRGRLNWIDGVSTFHTATVVILGDHFIGKDIGFDNYAGPEKHQAVALRVGSDMSIFYNCQIDGYQDTLYAHTYRQYYRNCVISGTIDFIFGDSAALFQNCTMLVRRPLDNQANIITAHGRKEPRQPTGLVLQNCNLVADPAYYPDRFTIKTYMARPWKEFSRTIIMESFIDDLISPDGFMPWEGEFGLDTCYYTEYNNRGPGSIKFNRTTWRGIKEVSKSLIKEHFTANKFLDAKSWLSKTGVPYYPGLIYPTPLDRPNAAKDDDLLDLERDNSNKHNFDNATNSVLAAGNITDNSTAVANATAFVASILAPTPSSSPEEKAKDKEEKKEKKDKEEDEDKAKEEKDKQKDKKEDEDKAKEKKISEDASAPSSNQKKPLTSLTYGINN
ncbi:pectinesterase-like [Impatiens glandulifera]|uniref:pectinesterase-like n=1 Tax=Impatiens glandulifera TaxID=253017 RepID=UPI001FB0D93D|nr:pectinesterase-like [Impatiens glandulifera]